MANMTKTNSDMTNHLAQAVTAALKADGEDLMSIDLVRAEGNEDEQLVLLQLNYVDGFVMTVSFYVYADGSWFSPWDWHGYQPQHKCEAEGFDWQLGVTGRKAVNLGGAPRMML